MEDYQLDKLIKHKNENLYHKEERIQRLSFPCFINYRLNRIANNATQKAVAVLVPVDRHYTVALCYKGNVVQVDAANDTYYRLSPNIPMFDTCTTKNGMQNDGMSCKTFALQMAEDLIEYYDKNPFPELQEGQELVEVPKELRQKWAVYAQSTEGVNRFSRDFTPQEKPIWKKSEKNTLLKWRN